MNGSTNKVNHITASTIEAFNIRNFIDRLQPTKEKNRYICPVCGGNNLTISDDPHKIPPPYQCWNNCDCDDIREAVAPWEEKTGRRTGARPKKKATPQPKEKIPAPLPIPFNTKLALLPQRATDAPPSQKPSYIPKPVKAKASENVETAMETVYKYSETQSVVRFDWEDSEKDKGRDKTFVQTHIDSNGRIIWRKGDAPWYGYKQDEATDAAEETFGTPAILWVEGEKNVEIARSVGLAAISAQGSNWREADLRVILDRLKEDLGQPVQIFLTDNDANGTGDKKGETFALACQKAGLPFLVIPCRRICHNIPNKGDIEQLLQNMDGDELIRILTEQIELAAVVGVEEAEGFEDSGDIPDTFNPVVEFLQIAFSTLYRDKPWICYKDELYCWNERNYYKKSPDDVEIKRIRDFCNAYAEYDRLEQRNRYPYANPGTVKRVLEWVKMSVLVPADSINPPGLNCTNGVLRFIWSGEKGDIPTWKLVDHSPEFRYIYEPMATYDPEADPTHCERLLQALDAPQREIFLRSVAASLDLTTVRKHKGRLVRAILAKGDGSNGKDSLREVVALMYGKQGMTSCGVADFEAYDNGRKFPLAKLAGSVVNWSSENAILGRLDKIQSLKAAITGDSLDCERKGVDPEEFDARCICIFNINDMPNLQGSTEAIKSRYGILDFNKTFKIGADPSKGEIEADPRFKYDPLFVRTMVVPAFLNRVLQALVDLMKDGIDFSCTEGILKEIQSENSHLFQFCQDVGLGYQPNSTVTASQIWQMLQTWYEENGTLTYEGTKAVWAEQSRPSDKNVKAANQVIQRFLQLFPKAKRVHLPGANGKGKGQQALAGIGFVGDNSFSISPTVHPISSEVHPNFTQQFTQQTLTQQGSSPSSPNFSTQCEKNFSVQASDFASSNFASSNFEPEFEPEKETDSPNLGELGETPHSSSIVGVNHWVKTGCTDNLIGCASDLIENETSSPNPPPDQQDEAISLLMVEQTGGNIAPFIGCQVQVRSITTGKVKFSGEMIGYNSKNGFVTLATPDGERTAFYQEAFVVD